MTNEPESDLDELGDFLEDHYEKFAIMGIFGTVTVFLSSNWPGGSDNIAARVGIAAALFIFSLSAFWIAMKCFQLIRAASGEWPGVPEIGYVVVLAGTLSLGGAVLSASQIYTAASQLLGEFALAMILALIYARVYPGDLDLPSQEEPPRYETQSAFAMLGGLYFAVVVYGPKLRSLTRGALGLDFVVVVPLAIMFGFVYFAIRESLIGISQVTLKDSGSFRRRIIRAWDVRTSLAVSVLSIGFLTLYTREIAQKAIEPNGGYYQVLGFHSTEFTLFHWLGIAVVFALLILHGQHSEDSSQLRDRIAQGLALLTVLVVAVEAIWFIPNGIHVLPMI